jgi:tRNA A-37 threonylcarbamoyl transferase component Bud32
MERFAAAIADRYRLESELGQGGMATVYLAEDLRHQRRVAIKLLREDLAASMGSARFLREIQIAAQLQHPNILPLLDSGDTGGFLYYVMPYVTGQSLRERLAREGELPVPEAIRLLVEVVDALAEAHRHGVVHRDIKPDNVMLSGRHALVADFGVAKAISEATGRNTVTTLGVAVGTPAYMSPEQAAADPHIDHRSDIYAIGVMAYEMLSGRPPFTGTTPQQILAAHVTEVPDSVAKRRTAIPPALEQIVMRCLAKRPADRFQTAEALLQELEAFTTPSGGMTPTQTRPVTAVQQPTARRRWFIATAPVLLLVALGLWRWWRAPAAIEFLDAPHVQATFTGTAELAALSPDGQRVAYGERDCGADYRCTYSLVVHDIGGTGNLRAATDLAGLYDISWSGDGRSILFSATSPQGQFGSFIVPSLGGATPRFVHPDIAYFLGAGDSIIVYVRNVSDRLALVAVSALDPRNGDTLHLARPGVKSFWGPSPNGRLLLVGAPATTNSAPVVLILDRGGRTIDSVLPAPGESALGWSKSGGVVLAVLDSVSTGFVSIVELATNPSGKLTGKRRILVRSMALALPKLSMAGLSYLAGSTNQGLYAVERATVGATTFTARKVAGSTAALGALIAGDGRAFIVTRIAPVGAFESSTQISLLPFAGGAERPLTSGIRNVIGTSRTVAGDAYVVVHRDGPRSRITRIELATGRATDLGTMADTLRMDGTEVLRDGSIAWRIQGARPQGIRVRDTSGTVRVIPTPQLSARQLDDSPDGHGMIGWGWNEPTGDSLIVFHIAPGATGAKVLLQTVAEGVSGLHWLPDGSVEMVLNETIATAALYHIDLSTGAVRRVVTLPINFLAGLSFSLDGLRMGALTEEAQRDVWVVRW